MNDPQTQYRTGRDRMDHPLSHAAAVVGGVAFLFFAGCMSLLLSDSKMLRSTTWWGFFSLSTAVLSVSIIGYFRPHSRAIYIPVVLAGVVTLGLCVGHAWHVWHPSTKTNPLKMYHSLELFSVWLAWAARTIWLIRRGRPSVWADLNDRPAAQRLNAGGWHRAVARPVSPDTAHRSAYSPVSLADKIGRVTQWRSGPCHPPPERPHPTA
ncbi:MAG TPA: hypothetical protein VGB55_12805 [Tepidisphaeraceae bacterium]|jgi:hypothetical protein